MGRAVVVCRDIVGGRAIVGGSAGVVCTAAEVCRAGQGGGFERVCCKAGTSLGMGG